ncbi:SOH1-domain-containing protein [Lineolata rhizophorae]|uniref:Mediator of RNA polymerase II transcription subunit 31 n=1 Tax=Lineolata rhizophorae TaxID=578093 RepID=A0A6A6NW44_9PEZI|nr:SOH1-domain-containing protein [Lineolata rhizophorae]
MASNPTTMTTPPPPPPQQQQQQSAAEGVQEDEDRYGGYTRFELELEFVQCLGNPAYLNYLAAQKLLDKADFVAYLDYLQYFTQPKYIKFITHPPALKALELLQQERFRKEILMPDVMTRMMNEGIEAALDNQRQHP